MRNASLSSQWPPLRARAEGEYPQADSKSDLHKTWTFRELTFSSLIGVQARSKTRFGVFGVFGRPPRKKKFPKFSSSQAKKQSVL